MEVSFKHVARSANGLFDSLAKQGVKRFLDLMAILCNCFVLFSFCFCLFQVGCLGYSFFIPVGVCHGGIFSFCQVLFVSLFFL